MPVVSHKLQAWVAAAILIATVGVVYGVTAPKPPRYVLQWEEVDGAIAYRVTLYEGSTNRCTSCHIARTERVTEPEIDLGSVCNETYTAIEICSIGPDNKTGGCTFEQIVYEH